MYMYEQYANMYVSILLLVLILIGNPEALTRCYNYVRYMHCTVHAILHNGHRLDWLLRILINGVLRFLCV